MPAANWFLLIYLGLNTVLAYGSLALAIKLTEATRVSVIITLNPIITFVTMAILTRMEVSWIEPESFSMLSFSGSPDCTCRRHRGHLGRLEKKEEPQRLERRPLFSKL